MDIKLHPAPNNLFGEEMGITEQRGFELSDVLAVATANVLNKDGTLGEIYQESLKGIDDPNEILWIVQQVTCYAISSGIIDLELEDEKNDDEWSDEGLQVASPQ